MSFSILVNVLALTGLIASSACERPSQEMAMIGRMDTLSRQAIQSRGDTSQARKNTNGFGPHYEEVKRDFEKFYTDTLRLDSTYLVGREMVRLHFSHYCNSETITIPSRYNWGREKTEYTAHVFVSEIAIVRAGTVVYHRVITKKRFEPILDESLNAFGVLLYPDVSFDGAGRVFSFHYSISIPLTDVGTPVVLEVDLNGREKIAGG